MPRVIVSSGHTSRDPGSKANGLIEYEVARKIAKATLPLLRQHGVITLSVPPDLDLEKRVDWINKAGYEESKNDIAIEVHINEGGKSGIETWYEGKGDSNSKKLSDLLLDSTATETELPKEGSKSEYDHEFGSIAFLHDVDAITSLVECGYIDNENDVKLLKEDSGIEKIAIGIVKGILKYFGIEFREITSTQQPQISPQPSPAQPQQQPSPAMQNPQQFQPNSFTPPAQNNFANTNQPMQNMPPNGSGFNQFGQNQQSGMGNAGFMSRDDRKKMIEDQYVKILGREPNQNDLNYFLNTGISEADLIKKMVESQEHADLVKARQEVIKAKEEAANQKTELSQLRASVEDQKIILQNLHSLLAQKNQNIAQMQQQLGMMQNYQNNPAPTPQLAEEKPQTTYKGTFLDRLFKAFSDLFE